MQLALVERGDASFPGADLQCRCVRTLSSRKAPRLAHAVFITLLNQLSDVDIFQNNIFAQLILFFIK